jgi:hypothetical protein
LAFCRNSILPSCKARVITSSLRTVTRGIPSPRSNRRNPRR